jgi:Leucine-rich repeat (LRR) protein
LNLTCLPKTIATLTRLSLIDLSDTQIHFIPPSYVAGKHFPQMDLTRTPLSSRLDWSNLEYFHNLPDKVGQDVSVKYEWLWPLIRTLPDLESLNLAGNNLKNTHSNISLLKNLRDLNLANNNLDGNEEKETDFFRKFSVLPLLRNLDLSKNDLTDQSFAIEDFSCTSMEMFQNDALNITFSDNELISGVFYRIDRIKGFTRCDRSIATEMFLFRSMKSIVERILPMLDTVEFWGVEGVPEKYRFDMRDFFNLANPDKLIRLIMLWNMNGAYPNGTRLRKFTNLVTLGLRGNFSTPPEELYSLTNLASLGIQSDGLWSLSPKVGQLTKLTELRINNRGVGLRGGVQGPIPVELSKLTRLRVFDVSGNTDTTGRLPTLRNLDNAKPLECMNFCRSDGLIYPNLSAVYNGSMDYPCPHRTHPVSDYTCCRMRAKESASVWTISPLA